ncbi:unnamed protein product [Phaeothamnion confervicola]
MPLCLMKNLKSLQVCFVELRLCLLAWIVWLVCVCRRKAGFLCMCLSQGILSLPLLLWVSLSSCLHQRQRGTLHDTCDVVSSRFCAVLLLPPRSAQTSTTSAAATAAAAATLPSWPNKSQYTSFGGVLAIAYTVFFVVLRCLDGSYAPGGRFYAALAPAMRPPAGASPWRSVGLWRAGGGLTTLMNVSCVAFMAHYNGVKYYEELRHRTVRRCAKAVSISLAISFAVFAAMMVCGFGTFGASTLPLLLNNYHPTDDMLAALARLSCGLAILCGYPLMFAALKSTFGSFAYEVLSKSKRTAAAAPAFLTSPDLQRAVAMALQAVITAIACNQSEEDVAVVIGLIGALLGSSANYIIPAVFNLKLLARDRGPGKRAALLSEASFNKLLIVFGAVFMVMGTAATFQGGGGHGGHH